MTEAGRVYRRMSPCAGDSGADRPCEGGIRFMARMHRTGVPLEDIAYMYRIMPTKASGYIKSLGKMRGDAEGPSGDGECILGR